METDAIRDPGEELETAEKVGTGRPERRGEPRAATPAPATEWARFLLAWLPDPAAVLAVLGRPPRPGDDTASAMAVVERTRAARRCRPAYSGGDPRVPAPEAALRAIADRADIQAAFATMRWEPAWVDLTSVLSVQQLVRLSGLGERVGAANADPAGLVDLVMPSGGPQQITASTDGDGKAVTISSPNPNLRVVGSGLGEVEPEPGKKQLAVSILIGGAASYLQVAEYRGRYFLRDGYHRAVGLLRRGITVIPCVFVFPRSLQELTPNNGLFAEDVLFDERPPAVADFLDASVTFTIRRPSPRKFIRVRGDEFNH